MGVVYPCARASWTPVAVADGTIYAANNYDAYVAGAAPRIARAVEISVNGETASSTVNQLAFRRHSTAAVTPTAKTPEKTNPSSPAIGGTYFQTAATQPTSNNGTHAVGLSINAYGGEYRWVAGQGTSVEIYFIGGSSGNNEGSIGCFAGTSGQISSHMMIEEL